MSGEFLMWISLSLWTVAGFPSPQQFQLNTVKEPGVEETENLVSSSRLLVSAGFALVLDGPALSF